jgi:branched-chain amino acid transport system permease protein
MIEVLSNETFQALLAVNILLAFGIYLMVVTGQLSLGQAGFMAVGAYAASYANVEWGWPVAAGLLLGVMAAALIAVPVSVGANRLRGIYLIIGTLAVGETIRIALTTIKPLGDVQGYFGQVPVGPASIFAACAAIFVLLAILMASPLGLAMRAVRDDEDAAAAAGIPVRAIKIGAVIAGAAITGLAGAFYAHHLTFIRPDNFDLSYSFLIALFVLIGGSDHLLGPIVGAFFLTYLPEAFEFFEEYQGIAYGVFVLAVMVFSYRGLVTRERVLTLRRLLTRIIPWAPWGVLERTVGRLSVRRRVSLDGQTGPRAPIVELRGLGKRFGGVVALDGIDLQLARGEVTGLIGPNGAGKSTLINVATGLLRATVGEVRLAGRDVTRFPAHRRAAMGMARTFQAVRLFPHLTVGENLRTAAPDHGRLPVWLDLDQVDGRLPSELPYGDQRKLQIAQALAALPNVVFLDEPSIGMSAEEINDLVEIISATRDQGTAIVLVDHNLDVVMEVADRIVVLDFGRKLAEGTPEEIVENRDVQTAYLGTTPLAEGT